MAGIMEVRYVKNDVYIDEETVYFFKFQQDNRRIMILISWTTARRGSFSTCTIQGRRAEVVPAVQIQCQQEDFFKLQQDWCRGNKLKVVETFKQKLPGITNKLHERFKKLYISSSSSKTIGKFSSAF